MFQPPGPIDNTRYGVQYGIVTQNKDPDGLGRVKVRFPWLDRGDTDESNWAQVTTPMEGSKFGWYTMPDIDDVVLVMFIDGDSAFPIVVGGVWSTADGSPEANGDGKNNFRGYRSRSGSRLILDDSSKSKVVLADKTGTNVIAVGAFDKDGSGDNTCAAYKPPMAGDGGVAIASTQGKLELTCKDGKLSVQGQNIKINALTSVEIKAGQDLKLDGTSATKLTSNAPSNYDASQVNLG